MELTLPGFRHDMCSTILPLTLASPFFPTIDLAARGVELIHPDAPVAHPLDGGRAVVLERSVAATAAALAARTAARGGGCSGRSCATPRSSARELLRPVVHVPRHPLAMAAVRPAGAALDARPGPRPVRRTTPRGRCSPASRRTPCCRSTARSSASVRAGPRALRPCGRLADGPRRCVGRGGGARRGARGGRRRGGDRPPGRRSRGPAAGARDDPRRHAPPAPGHRRRSAAGADTAAMRAVPLRAGRVQAGLGARWPGPVGRRRAAPRGHGPPRRHARRDRGVRGGRRRRPPPRQAVRAVRAVRAVGHRPVRRRARPRPGRTATCRRARTST